MTIYIYTKPKEKTKLVIDLDGPMGNANVLLAYAKQYAEELGLDGDAIAAEMRSGNYDNLIRVFDKHFGEYVDLMKTEEV